MGLYPLVFSVVHIADDPRDNAIKPDRRLAIPIVKAEMVGRLAADVILDVHVVNA
jgi:hypothetical protein